MKPAERIVSYCVYSPNYVPRVGEYRRAKTLKAAKKQCRKKGFGIGSEIVRHYETRNRNGDVWLKTDRRDWLYNGG